MEPKLILSHVADILGYSQQHVHGLIKEKNVKTSITSNRVFISDPKEAKKLLGIKLKKKPFTICIQTSKGGVGKTSIVAALSIRFYMLGLKVLVVDLDQQGNLTKYLLRQILEGKRYTGHVLMDVFENKCSIKECIKESKTGLSVIPSSQRNATLSTHMIAYGLSPIDTLSKYLDELKNDFDVILFDTPPAISHINSSATYASDLVISPVIPDDDAIDGMLNVFKEVQGINKNKKENIEFKVLLNDFDLRKTLSSQTLLQIQELEKQGINGCLLNTVLSTSQDYANAKNEGDSLFEYTRQGRASKDIHSLSLEILESIRS